MTNPSNDPMSLYVQVQQVRARKLAEQLKEHNGGGHDHPRPGSHTVVARTILDLLIDTYLKYKWCNDLVNFMNDNIKILQEKGDQMTEEQKKELRGMTVEALDMYGDHC